MKQSRSIALIGYGEVGTIFAQALAAQNCRVSAFDIKFNNGHLPRDVPPNIKLCHTAKDAGCGSDIVISAVTAASATDVARDAARFLTSEQFFLDLNSVSPETKRRNADVVGRKYVEAAIMASVPPFGLKVPMLLGGSEATELVTILNELGMNGRVVSERIGSASAIKMCRSIMVKGLEALTVESMMTARYYGAEDEVLVSLVDTFPGTDWNSLAGYLIGRSIEHGRRRAAEMREAAATASDAGLKPVMAPAAADCEDWMADLAEEIPELTSCNDSEWRQTLDMILARLSPSGSRGSGTSLSSSADRLHRNRTS